MGTQKGGLPVEANRIILGDCIEEMGKLPDACVDTVFADPPYNLQLKGDLHRPDASRVDGVEDAWDRFDDFAAYDAFSEAWLKEAHRVLKDDGTLWVIGSYHNIYRVGKILQDLGFWILNDVVWVKTNPMPNFRGRRFTNAHETMIWAAKSPDARYRFNYKSMKALNEDLQMRSDWVLPICTGEERLKNGEGKKAHSTQKPEALLYRVLLSCTETDDLVLDPFSGSGTTATVAKRLRRRYIGIEAEKDYVALANNRLKNTKEIDDMSLLELTQPRQQARIPFGRLIEAGLLTPGTVLSDPKGKHTARVRADGTLISAEHKGSIHQVAAACENQPSCNGWQYWNLEIKGKLVPIDVLRQKMRAQLH